jgi:hypothetical protein
MDVAELRRTVDELELIDVVVADRDALDRVVVLLGRVRSAVDAVEVSVARRVASLSTSVADESPTDVLAAKGKRSRRDARASADRSTVCDRMPGFEAALAAGTIGAGHVDAVARATRNLDDAGRSAVAGFADDLLAAAMSRTLAEFERECRDLARFVAADDGASELDRQRSNARVSRWVDKQSGMWHLHAEVDPETGAKLWTAIDSQLRSVKQREGNGETPLERLTVVALTELLTGSSALDRRVPEVCVHIDQRSLVGGWHQGTICELATGIPLPIESVRRMCCDAVIVPIVVAHDGQAVDAGREQRTATRKQRRMLRSMYRTCAHPHCDVAVEHCDVHHVIWWELLGRTDLDNMVPLCSRHHHLVHEGGWRLTMASDRVITLVRPDGSTMFVGSTIDRHPMRRPAEPPGAARAAPSDRSRAQLTQA